MLGQVIAQLLGMQAPECAVRKGRWWLRQRQRLSRNQTVLMTVQSPGYL